MRYQLGRSAGLIAAAVVFVLGLWGGIVALGLLAELGGGAPWLR